VVIFFLPSNARIHNFRIVLSTKGVWVDKIIIGKSIEEIVNTYSDILVRIAFNNVKSIADAEDVVQDVYIKLMSNKKDFVNEEHLKSWLIRDLYQLELGRSN